MADGTERAREDRSADVVLFDIGGTILHAEPPVPEVFAATANRLGFAVTVRDLEPVIPEVDAFYEREYLRDGEFWCSHERSVNIWLDMYGIMARAVGIDDGSHELAWSVYRAYEDPANWGIYPDVRACLTGLKRRGFSLGVVSNWDASLERLLRGLRLLPYFDEVVSSAAVGCRKPSSAIFELALERLGVEPDRAVHVGDLPEADGEGAKNAGIRPIIIDRADALGAECPFERIRSLEALVSLL